MKIKTREEAMSHLSAKVTADDKFKKELMSDPKRVLEREFDTGPLPEDVKITVLEETPTQLYIVIPSSSVVKTPINLEKSCRADTHWWHKGIEIEKGRPVELEYRKIR